ncbi:MAG TPA: hypothetical protein VFQ45_15665 [Longimicrobium sp.]|nr:hypothetical protein [Longimicrobium sp.]
MHTASLEDLRHAVEEEVSRNSYRQFGKELEVHYEVVRKFIAGGYRPSPRTMDRLWAWYVRTRLGGAAAG